MNNDNSIKGTILIIDDTVNIINMVRTALTKKNFHTLVATNGNTGAKIAQTAQPDLILLDIMMPGMDGYETCNLLKSEPSTAHIPVIYMSALTDVFDKVKAFSAGGVDYVTKPLNIDELIARVDTHISLHYLQKQLKETNEKLEKKVEERTDELKKKNQELQKANNDLFHAKEEAENSDRLKTEFLNNLSHEIRTPMNGIIGFTEFLENDDNTKEEQSQYIEIIKRSSNQLLMIIDDILEISALETKQVEVRISKVNLKQLILEIVSSFEHRSIEKNVPVYFKQCISIDNCLIYSDKPKLHRIISILLENALKYTNEGQVDISCEKKDNELIIQIRDTGIGIETEHFEMIFQRFSQEYKEITKKTGGLGLGLAIAQENAKLLEGKITVTSQKKVGSCFEINIPFKPVEKEELNENTKEPKEKLKILIAEDEEINTFFLNLILKKELKINCLILNATNGIEAIEICQEHDDIDIVLMDIKMPEMNGIEATKKILSLRPQLPIIAQTAYSTEDDQQKIYAAGCVGLISKPIEKDELKSLIMTYAPYK